MLIVSNNVLFNCNLKQNPKHTPSLVNKISNPNSFYFPLFLGKISQQFSSLGKNISLCKVLPAPEITTMKTDDESEILAKDRVEFSLDALNRDTLVLRVLIRRFAESSSPLRTPWLYRGIYLKLLKQRTPLFVRTKSNQQFLFLSHRAKIDHQKALKSNSLSFWK